MFNKVEFCSERDDLVYFGTGSVSEGAVMSHSPDWYSCENGTDRLTDRALPATHSRLSSHHLRLALSRTAGGIGRRLLERRGKVPVRDVRTFNLILRRLRCCPWSLMLFAEISSHRLEIIRLDLSVLLDSLSHRLRGLWPAYEKPDCIMEYRHTLVPLLVLFALRTLAYGKFKLACCWLCLHRWSLYASYQWLPN